MNFTYELLKSKGYRLEDGVLKKSPRVAEPNERTPLVGLQKAPRRRSATRVRLVQRQPTIRLTLEERSCRPKDPDNLAGSAKAFIDALRYMGIIPNDTSNDIELLSRSIKVNHLPDECIEIILEII